MVPFGTLVAADVNFAVGFVLVAYRARVELDAFFSINLWGGQKKVSCRW